MENTPGALSRVAGLFSARAFNIESLTVAPTEDASVSRMTLVTAGTDELIEQINKQLNKLLDIIKLEGLDGPGAIERELLLIKVAIGRDSSAEIKRLVDIFRGRIIDINESSCVVEMTGTGDKLDAFINVLGKGTILEVARSGVVGIKRGAPTQ